MLGKKNKKMIMGRESRCRGSDDEGLKPFDATKITPFWFYGKKNKIEKEREAERKEGRIEAKTKLWFLVCMDS